MTKSKTKDKLHWSFCDNAIMLNEVFPRGFSAEESTLPKSAFNPVEDWENSYDVVYAGPNDFTEDNKIYYGSLRIKAAFKKDRVNLNVRGIRQLQQNYRFERQHTQAEFTCCRDNLFSLKKDAVWSIKNNLKNRKDPATKPYAKIDETGRLLSDKIEKKTHSGKWFTYRKIDPKIPVVSDWALLAAIQKLPRDKVFKFGYFPQLERFASGHRIRFLESFRARFGKHEINLHGYAQTGPGITPFFYWVDDNGRLLIARFALSAIVYNPDPRVEKEGRNDS